MDAAWEQLQAQAASGGAALPSTAGLLAGTTISLSPQDGGETASQAQRGSAAAERSGGSGEGSLLSREQLQALQQVGVQGDQRSRDMEGGLMKRLARA